jgi:hypothetical protein
MAEIRISLCFMQLLLGVAFAAASSTNISYLEAADTCTTLLWSYQTGNKVDMPLDPVASLLCAYFAYPLYLSSLLAAHSSGILARFSHLKGF